MIFPERQGESLRQGCGYPLRYKKVERKLEIDCITQFGVSASVGLVSA